MKAYIKRVGKAMTEEAIPVTIGGVGSKVVKNLSKTAAKKFFDNHPMAVKFVPIVPAIVGAAMMGVKNNFAKNIGVGMFAVGITDTAGNFVPFIAALEDTDLSGIFDDMADDLSDDPVHDDPLHDDVSGEEDDY